MALMTTLVLALRGAAAVGVLTTVVGGIPRLVQLGLAVLIGVWSALLVDAGRIASADLVVVGARELVIGASIGIVAAMPILAVVTAGRIVDVVGSARGSYRGLFAVLAAAVFVGLDGHVAFVTAIVESFRAVPALEQTPVLEAIGGLLGNAVRLAVPWMVTAAVVEIAVGVGMRLAGRAGWALPTAAAVPAALVMMTAALVATLAVAFASLLLQ